ncbi:hypothetical protein EIN_495460 [Entamoeba invadens IP1]|uniref:Nucleoside transporter n=1 Tax=Entamoeba invadens IP1 TaxID=370355 RepID=A0A0A1TZR4_ENTIV|nr:hypothetical protein EIN_495460 [Entamoeba invadens IP1]ELP87091.1 hypothetical protein EIN_495460 [Entamoeba invadens IP1]|eukprot:XP_004253862.1 hypothetical protein EIN_495460 [Entamoeba invadens IP1]
MANDSGYYQQPISSYSGQMNSTGSLLDVNEDSSIIRKSTSLFNPDLSTKHNIETFLLCLVLGTCFNFHGTTITSTTAALGVNLGNVSLFYFVPIVFYITNLITVIFLVVLSFVTPKYPFFPLSCITLLGQYILTLIMTPSYPPVLQLFDHFDPHTVNLVFGIFLVFCSFINGILSAINFSTFVYISITLSPSHLIGFIIGTSSGPFLSALINLINNLTLHHKQTVYIVITLTLVVIIPLFFISYFFYCYKTIPHLHSFFHQTEETTFLSINNRIPSKFKRFVLSIKASVLEIKHEMVTLKYCTTSLFLVYFCSNYIFPGMLNNFNITTSAETITTNNNSKYVFHLNVISFIFTGFDLCGSIACFAPFTPSKKTILGVTLSRVILFVVFCTILNIGALLGIDSKEETSLLKGIQNVIGTVDCLATIILGASQGYLTAHCILKICKRVEERVGTNVVMLMISLGGFLGGILQVIILSVAQSFL